ncbi:MAG: hypothetical protein PF637_14480 [Spirochaetes bacterium]|jgi:hypothetical protein|nr:hypothetical protein [Spirochaetota bacterium]
MKRAIISSIFLLVCIIFFGCGGATPPDVRPPVVEPEPAVAEPEKPTVLALGWIGEDIFRVRTSGNPAASAVTDEDKQKTALDKAVSDAQRKVVEKFVITRITGLSATDDIASTGIAIQEEFGPAIRSGRVIQELYDNAGSCTIIYEVELENLKRRVTDASFKEK